MRNLPQYEPCQSCCLDLSPSQNVGKDDGLARALIERGIVAQRDQALILAEAACLEVACLLTLDSDIVAVEERALTEAIEEADLHPFEIKTVQPA